MIDNYEAAWKALQASIVACPQKTWTGKQLFEHIFFLELQYTVGLVGEALKIDKEVE